MMSDIDWDNVKINAWYGSLSRLNDDEPEVLDIIKQTKTFLWVVFRGRVCKLRKSAFLADGHAYIHLPFMDFGIKR